MTSLDQRSYFFDRGIRFGCRRCGACCTGDSGVVRVSPAEVEAIAEYLKLPVARLVEAYTAPWEEGLRIREHSGGRCLFFMGGCQVYPVRPNQCATFPFWFTNLRSEARWHTIRRQCPGIGAGRRYTKDEILDILAKTFSPSCGKPLSGRPRDLPRSV